MFTQVSSESSDLAEQLRLLQAQFDELRMRVETGTAGGAVVAPSPSATTATPPTAAVVVRVPPPSAAEPSEQPPAPAVSTPDPLECIELANGRMFRFSKWSIPDPPSISFAKDLPRLVRMWDDGSPEWNPSEAVLHIQGEPIALKYWPLLYRYGKPGQWTGTKKNWAKWQVRVCPCSLL